MRPILVRPCAFPCASFPHSHPLPTLIFQIFVGCSCPRFRPRVLNWIGSTTCCGSGQPSCAPSSRVDSASSRLIFSLRARLGLVSPWFRPYGFKTGESAHRTPSILGKLYQRRGRGGRRETPSLPPPSLVLLPLDLPSRPSSVYHVAHPSTDFVHSLTLSHTLVLAFRIDPLRSFFTSLVHVLSLTHP